MHRLGYTHLAFAVDDLAEEMRRLSAAGMSFWAVPITDRSGRQLVYGARRRGS